MQRNPFNPEEQYKTGAGSYREWAFPASERLAVRGSEQMMRSINGAQWNPFNPEEQYKTEAGSYRE